MKSQRVKTDDSLAPALDDEAETIERLLAVPKAEIVTINGVLCFDKDDAEKCLNFDDFSSGFDYGLDTFTGGRHSAHPCGLHSDHPRHGDYEFELGIFDGLLDEIEEVEDIDATDGLATPSDDFLLDIGFTGVSVLEFGPRERSNGNTESQSPGLSGSSNSAVGVSESSTVTIQEFECKNSSHPKESPHKFPDEVRWENRCHTPVEGTYQPSLFCIKSLDRLDNDHKPLVNGLLSSEIEKGSDDANKNGAIIKNTRLPKTAQGRLKRKAKDLVGTDSICHLTATEDQCLNIRSRCKYHHTKPRTLPPVPEEDPISDNLTLSELKICLARTKKQAIQTEFQPITSDSEDEIVGVTTPEKHEIRQRRPIKSKSNDEKLTMKVSKNPSERKHQHIISKSECQTVPRRRSTRINGRKHHPLDSDFEDERKKSRKNDRRKHQRLWDISEVMTLVDGISDHGVAQWTRIKRLLFTSSYRTPMDIRDKWRNLLNNCCHRKSKKELEENDENDMDLPKSLIYRVRELAKKHPYPRQRGKRYCPPILPAESKGATSEIIQYVRRKNRS